MLVHEKYVSMIKSSEHVCKIHTVWLAIVCVCVHMQCHVLIARQATACTRVYLIYSGVGGSYTRGMHTHHPYRVTQYEYSVRMNNVVMYTPT